MKKTLRLNFNAKDTAVLVDFLAEKSGISKAKLKDAMVKGAVWIRGKTRKGTNRVRRATTELRAGDAIDLYYDDSILSLPEIKPIELRRGRGWVAYYKPKNMLSQGTKFGDHLSLLRFVEKTENEAYLIHRLDREASGVMVVATNKKMATELSKQFAENKVKKIYRAIIEGQIENLTNQGVIEIPLEGKEARTEYKILTREGPKALVEINLHTGRTHQIRKHFALKKCPLFGDVEYGDYTGQDYDLPLVSHSLEFFDPGTKKNVLIELPHDLVLSKITDINGPE